MKQCITVFALSCSLSVGLSVAAYSQPQDSVRTRQDRERELEGILDNYRANRPAPVDQSPNKVAPVTTQTTNALPSVVTGSKGIGTLPEAVAITEESKIKAAALTILPRLISGEMSVSEAWQKKALSIDDVKWILGEYVDAWGGFDWKKNVSLRRELARVAWENGGAEWQMQVLAPKVLSRPLRLWLADYLGSVNDERAVAICEQILKETPMPATGGEAHGDKPLVFQTVERLGWFYRDKGDDIKSAQSWLRMETMFAEPGWWVPDSLVAAARAFWRSGDKARAKVLYERVPPFGNGWLTGLTYYDQASELLTQGQHEEARRLLLLPLSGDGAEHAEVLIAGYLAYSYYRTAEWEQARRWSEETLSKYGRLQGQELPEGRNLIGAANDARNVLSWTQRWAKEPLVCEVPSGTFRGERGDESASRSFAVRAFRPVVLNLESNGDVLTAQTVGDWQDRGLFYEQQVNLRLLPEVLEKRIGAWDEKVIVKSASPVDFAARVNIPIRIDAPVRVQPGIVFLGVVKPEANAQSTLRLSSRKPFRVLGIETGVTSLQVRAETNVAATQHDLKVTWTAPKTPEFFNGTLRITTDVLSQPVIEVLVAARVQ